MNMKKIKTVNKLKIFDIYNKKNNMKKLNQTYIDNLINRVITETLEGKANKLVSKIKEMTLTDDEVEEMMSSEVTEEEICEQCGSELKEGETCEQCVRREMKERRMAKLKKPPTEFDYVAEEEEEDVETKDDLRFYGKDTGEDPLDRANRFCNKDSDEYNEEACRYHKKMEGEMTEKLHGNQRKLDKNKNGKIDSQDFEMLRKKKQGYDDREDEREGMKHGKMKGKDLTSMKSRRDDARFERRGETEEGNAFTGALANAKAKGNDEFEVDGKEYRVTSESKNKNRIRLRESEMIDLIEKIIMQEQKSNIKKGSPKGLEKYMQIHQKDGKENDKALRDTAKKMKEYLKDGSKGKYDTNPNFFPKGNGDLAKMSKMAYKMSDAGKEFVDDFISPGMEDLVPDEIQYDEKWVGDNVKGSSRTGNNPEWANAVKTGLGDNIDKKLKQKKFRKAKEMAYRKSKQPVTDGTGENSGEGVNIKLESIDPKKTQKINEEFQRMKSLIGYNQKTQ